MASSDAGGLLSYWSLSGRQLEFARGALSTSSSPTAPHLFTALHSWQVQPPGRSDAQADSSDAGAPALDITLQSCTLSGQLTGPAVPVLRLPLDACANPAALSCCASPQLGYLRVNGRPFLTALPALSAVSSYCEACARGDIRGPLGFRSPTFASTEAESNAVAELWTMVAANAKEHGQPPEEVLLLLLLLNAARLAGGSEDGLGRLPSLSAYTQQPSSLHSAGPVLQGGTTGDGEREAAERALHPAEARALALVAAVVMQVAQILRVARPGLCVDAACLQLATLKALELRPQLAGMDRDDPIDNLIEATRVPLIVALTVPRLTQDMPLVFLSTLSNLLRAHADVEYAACMSRVGISLLDAALEAACPTDQAVQRAEATARGGARVSGSGGCRRPPAESAEGALWAVQLAEDVRAGFWLATYPPSGDDGCERLAHALATMEAAASTQPACPSATGTQRTARSRSTSERPVRSSAGVAEPSKPAAGLRSRPARVPGPGSTARTAATQRASAERGSASAPSSSGVAERASPEQRAAAARWLLQRAIRYLEALPRAYLARGQDFYTPARSVLSVPSASPVSRPAAYSRTLTTQQAPADAPRSADGSGPAMPAAPPLPRSGRTRLTVPSPTAQSDASLARALDKVLSVLEKVLRLELDKKTAEVHAPALGEALAPLLANPTYCHNTHGLVRVLAITLFAISKPPAPPAGVAAMAAADDCCAGPKSAGLCVGDGLLSGLAACGRRSVLDLLQALLLTGARDQFHVNVAECWTAAPLVQAQAMEAVLLLVPHVLQQAAVDSASLAEVKSIAERGAAQAIAFNLLLVVQRALTWRSEAPAHDKELLNCVGSLGDLAFRVLNQLGPLVVSHLPLPVDESLQVMMNALAAFIREPALWCNVPGMQALDHALEVLAQLTDRDDVVAAMAAAHGVPRLLQALRTSSGHHSACAAACVLRALCQRGPRGTHASFVACRGIQAMVRYLLLPPTKLASAPPTSGARRSDQQQLCKEWLMALRFGCRVLDSLVGRQLAAAQQLWGAVGTEVHNILQGVAAAEHDATTRSTQLFKEATSAFDTLLLNVRSMLVAHGRDTDSNPVVQEVLERIHMRDIRSPGSGCSEVDLSTRPSQPPGAKAGAQTPVIHAAQPTALAAAASRAPPAAASRAPPAGASRAPPAHVPHAGASSQPPRRRAGGKASALAGKPVPAETPEPADNAAALAAADAAMRALLQEEAQERQQRAQAAAAKTKAKAKVKSKKARKSTAHAAAPRSEGFVEASVAAGAAAAAEEQLTSPEQRAVPQLPSRSPPAGHHQQLSAQPPQAAPCHAPAPACVPAPAHAAQQAASPLLSLSPVSTEAAHLPRAAPAPSNAPAAMPAAEAAAAVSPSAAVSKTGGAPAGRLAAAGQLPALGSAAPAQAGSGLRAAQSVPPVLVAHEAPHATPPLSQHSAQLCSVLPCPAQPTVPPYMPQLSAPCNDTAAAAVRDSAQASGQPIARAAGPAGVHWDRSNAAGGSGLLQIPVHLQDLMCCPITQEPMEDPVMCADGHTYERAAVEAWLGRSATSPLTGQALAHTGLTPNHALRNMIQGMHQLVLHE